MDGPTYGKNVDEMSSTMRAKIARQASPSTHRESMERELGSYPSRHQHTVVNTTSVRTC